MKIVIFTSIAFFTLIGSESQSSQLYKSKHLNGLYDDCNSTDHCLSGRHLTCVDNMCECLPNFRLDFNNDTEEIECQYYECDRNDEDSCRMSYDHNRYCSRDGQCKCKFRFREDLINGLKCKQYQKNKCTEETEAIDCKINGSAIDKYICLMGECGCAPDHYFDEDTRTCVNTTCKTDHDCRQDWEDKSYQIYRKCDRGHCVCDDDHYDNGRLCIWKYDSDGRGWKWWLMVIMLPIIFSIVIIWGIVKLARCFLHKR